MKRGGMRKLKIRVVVAFLAVLAVCPPLVSWSQGPMPGSPLSSQARPTHAPPGTHYVGRNTCAPCHADKVETQSATAMANALVSAAEAQILRSHPRLTYRLGPYSYAIVRQGNQSLYTVTDGVNVISVPILWSFGKGKAGQTYVFRHNSAYYKSRVSFYTALEGLDVTIGDPHSIPTTLEDALGWPMSPAGAVGCFGCHATAAPGEFRLNLDHLTPGVRCEACHGAGEKHVAAVMAGNFKEKHIFNPRTLNTEGLSNFCGSCHGTWDWVALMGIRGPDNVRHAPYRLTNSRCYDADDRRISCVACHNPHENPQRDPAFYNAKCLACHGARSTPTQPGQRTPATCPIGSRAKDHGPRTTDQTQGCVTCHMPKIELPGAHFKFTDHHIRVVRLNESYPN